MYMIYIIYTYFSCLVAELSAFYQMSKTRVGIPASPPSTPTLEEDELVPNDLDIPPLSPPQPQRKVLHQCPIPGCSKKVVRLWNHVFQFHQKENKYTGIFIYLLPVCVRILRLTSQRVKLCCDIRRITKDNIYTYFYLVSC